MARFETTQWSLLVDARAGGSPGARAALERLCSLYWYPLYAFVRHKGHGPEDAEDLVQGFFAHVVEGDLLAGVHPEKGSLRSFLRVSCSNFLANRRDNDLAQKRGGGRPLISINGSEAADRYRHEPAHAWTAERLFDRRWALDLLLQAAALLREEMVRDGKTALFDRLRPALDGGPRGACYATIGRDLGLSEGAVKMAALRLRARYGQILRAAIADTVSDHEEVDDEIADLFTALAQK